MRQLKSEPNWLELIRTKEKFNAGNEDYGGCDWVSKMLFRPFSPRLEFRTSGGTRPFTASETLGSPSKCNKANVGVFEGRIP